MTAASEEITMARCLLRNNNFAFKAKVALMM